MSLRAQLVIVAIAIAAFAALSIRALDPAVRARTLSADQALLPCFSTARDAAAIAPLDSGVAALAKAGKPLDLPVVPTGRHAGLSIPNSCFAVEDAQGNVVFWKRPYGFGGLDASIPAWIPAAE